MNCVLEIDMHTVHQCIQVSFTWTSIWGWYKCVSLCVCVSKDWLALVYDCPFIHDCACSCMRLSLGWKPEKCYSLGGLCCKLILQWRLLQVLIKCTRQKPEFLSVFGATQPPTLCSRTLPPSSYKCIKDDSKDIQCRLIQIPFGHLQMGRLSFTVRTQQ